MATAGGTCSWPFWGDTWKPLEKTTLSLINLSLITRSVGQLCMRGPSIGQSTTVSVTSRASACATSLPSKVQASREYRLLEWTLEQGTPCPRTSVSHSSPIQVTQGSCRKQIMHCLCSGGTETHTGLVRGHSYIHKGS